MLRITILIVCAVSLVSCGGRWEDDAENWSRAFNGQGLPDGVTVIHSRYTRSPHFTYEADYFFELKAPQEFLDAWLVGLIPEPPSEGNLGFMHRKPAWFLPKPLKSYEMWRIADRPSSNFRLFRDKQTGVIFAKDCEG